MKLESLPHIKIADLHTDTVLEIQGGADLVKGNAHGHVDLQRMKEGKVAILTMACFVSSALPKARAFQEASALLDKCDEVVEGNPDQFRIIESAAEAVQAIAENKIALLLAIENGHVIENDLKKLEQLRRRRVRYMTVTHSRNLDWAFSSADVPITPGGLTALGRQVIAAMNDLGIIPDVSHVHESTFWEIIKISKKPVIASHSNAAALCPTPRNLTDDQIKAIAGTGGMIGINFFPAFLDLTFLQKQEERCGDLFRQLESMELKYMDNLVQKVQAEHGFNEKLRAAMQDVRVSIETIVDHLTYMIRLAGEDCVGFGSDMDGVPVLPEGMKGCGDYPKLVRAMQKRGIRLEAIEKICYRNLLRVLKDS
jgi:membrane dipeptidase